MLIPSPISIVCVCDNHYVILLAALIKSIEVNHSDGQILEFYIVEDRISEVNRQKVVDSVDSSRVKLNWLPIGKCIPANVAIPVDSSSLPSNIYARLFICEFLPKNIDKVIYLDVDMIVLRDIVDLWNVDIDQKIIAAVQDQFIQTVSRWGGVPNYEELNIAPENKYFNSGLLLINLERWRTADIPQRVLACITKNKKYTQFGDQYGLNAVLFNDWLEFDPLWNRFAYSEDKSPFLIHFTGRKPIYKTYTFSEDYRGRFYMYLGKTKWHDFKPISETERYFKKTMNVVRKYIQF